MDTSSLEEFSVSESLLTGSSSSSSCRNSESPSYSRSSRSSLIKIRSNEYSQEKYNWLPLTLAFVFILVLAIFILLLLLALAKVKQEIAFCEKEENPYEIRIYESNERLNHISNDLLKAFDPSRIRRNLRWMAKHSHISGTAENMVIMRRLASEYDRLGFDVKVYNYSVLLNYPDFNEPNNIQVKDEEHRWWIVSEGIGRRLGPPEAIREQSDPRSTIWWNAYSANGSVEGRIVYCNYGMPEDFRKLREMRIDVEGTIAFIRYGGISRAEKVKIAQENGAIGVILFSDPMHYTGTQKNRTFPDDIYLPSTDAQRGSLLATHGDPLTPLFPSLPYVQRMETQESAEKNGFLPKIPVMPIGYDDAKRVFDNLDGPPITLSNWKGAISSAYKTTGGRLFRLNVRSRHTRRTISNVVATMRGVEEPDRWVLVGNHVDAWGSGAIDPLSGTATQLEMARVASTVFRENKPRRSIVFCHWDAEEFGLIGSTEWIEQMQSVLNSRAIAYINVDHISGNSSLDVKSVPLLYKVVADAAERIPQLNTDELKAGRTTLLDSWKYYRNKGTLAWDRSLPEISLPAGGSDYQRFISFGGIASADLKMESAPGQSYALYHTMYETFWTVDHLIDPNYTSMLNVGQLWMEIVHQLANRVIIPFNSVHLAQTLTSLVQKAESQISFYNMSYHVPQYQHRMDNLKEALRRFHHTATLFQLEVQDISSGLSSISVSRAEQLNSRLQHLEKTFLDPFAFDNRIYRHLLFSPSKHPSQVTFLPPMLDPCIDFHLHRNVSYVDEFLFSFTRLQFAVESAIALLSL